ncbi:hypothetical protein GCM10027429_31740 [Marivirga atlantica]|jgi:hypothetical protein|uniref:Ig-like domain-containing protein n=1 Tax=Marivirga atlantica TaxID=1548457 RepID=A0A937AAR9_9BACT|nr:glucoamylase family protein [Marivirga atlantica]MBL0766750.1 Ig-like domain-containing protein [Marivirga atlantica]
MRHLSPLILLLSFLLLSCNEETPDAQNEILRLQSIRVGTTSLSPNEPEQEVPADQNIVITFSEELDRSSAESNLELRNNSGDLVDVSYAYLDNDKTISIIPSNFLPRAISYTLLIGEITSVNNSAFPGASYSFITEQGSFNLLSATLADNDLFSSRRIQNVGFAPTIQLSFSDSLQNVGAIQQFFTVKNRFGSALSSQLSLSNDHKNVSLTVSGEAQPLNKYTFEISDELRSATDLRFEGFTKEFYTQIDSTYDFPEISDDALLTKVQEQTFKYFWDFGHPVSGLARERNTSGNTVTIGGSGFGVMSILVGIERGFITRQEGVQRLSTIINFLENADRFHGVWPHWMNGNTGETIPFSANDDGADLVETAFMIEGLLAVRQYLDGNVTEEAAIISKITTLWEEVEWTWFQQEGDNVLTWHWSPNFDFEKNLKIRGWNEALVIYTLAASSPTYPITKQVYEEGWASNGGMVNGSTYYGYQLPLGYDRGGPLFFAHYSFLGMDPRNLEDQYANYMEQNIAHSLINRAYCIANPQNYVGYGENAWGLTASDTYNGYTAHSPTNDIGTITPTAAISSIPYTPEESMAAIKHFYYLMGDKLWGEYGFHDAYNVTQNWYANSYLAIDQGPIIIMIENYRTGLIWDLYMSDPDVQDGLNKLGFTY